MKKKIRNFENAFGRISGETHAADRRRASRRYATITLNLAALLVAATAGAQAPFGGLSSLHARLSGEAVEQGFGPAAGDHFGEAMAAGDFNGDGADELAVGIPGDDCNALEPDCGAVMVRWSVPGQGLGTSVQFLSQSEAGSPDPPEHNDRLGAALAVGDFNGDGRDDLAIGQPKLVYADPGGVAIHYGLAEGLQSLPEHFLRPGRGGVPAAGGPTTINFGRSVAVGDWNGDGFDDLAIGFPDDQQVIGGTVHGGGSVVVAHGGLGGVAPFDGYRISQAESGIPDDPDNGDRFGLTLVGGDFNGDHFDDLVIGVPQEDGVGAILVLFGSPNSLIFANNYWLGEVDLGTVAHLDDQFGAALAAADWNGDGFDDLAIGVPGRDNVNGDADIGMIGVLYGAPGSPQAGGGFNFAGRLWLWEDVIGSASDTGDRFGRALAAGDFNGDDYADLAIGVPGNGADAADGLVIVTAGSPSALGTSQQLYYPQFAGIPAPLGAEFGDALAAGDFEGDGCADLAIGMPKADPLGTDAGMVTVLHGALFADGFESGGLFDWSPPEN